VNIFLVSCSYKKGKRTSYTVNYSFVVWYGCGAWCFILTNQENEEEEEEENIWT